jgi:hypothetical protein
MESKLIECLIKDIVRKDEWSFSCKRRGKPQTGGGLFDSLWCLSFKFNTCKKRTTVVKSNGEAQLIVDTSSKGIRQPIVAQGNSIITNVVPDEPIQQLATTLKDLPLDVMIKIVHYLRLPSAIPLDADGKVISDAQRDFVRAQSLALTCRSLYEMLRGDEIKLIKRDFFLRSLSDLIKCFYPGWNAKYYFSMGFSNKENKPVIIEVEFSRKMNYEELRKYVLSRRSDGGESFNSGMYSYDTKDDHYEKIVKVSGKIGTVDILSKVFHSFEYISGDINEKIAEYILCTFLKDAPTKFNYVTSQCDETIDFDKLYPLIKIKNQSCFRHMVNKFKAKTSEVTLFRRKMELLNYFESYKKKEDYVYWKEVLNSEEKDISDKINILRYLEAKKCYEEWFSVPQDRPHIYHVNYSHNESGKLVEIFRRPNSNKCKALSQLNESIKGFRESTEECYLKRLFQNKELKINVLEPILESMESDRNKLRRRLNDIINAQ